MDTRVKIDFVGRASDGRWLMVLAEDGPWRPPYTAELTALQQRLYDCLDVVLDGALAARFPASIGARVAIVVMATGVPAATTRAFFERFADGVWGIPDYARALETCPHVTAIDLELQIESMH